ncbi:DUF6090 family protein [Winogradskyella flava]|uniref:Uncharacterized protein n=1 Tax=Winogradskyella flava TaxID=1884876 RepID=A0A842IXG3_9FLAO|nr:DUF6090 family protein [Winogradskyella flava]MBC2846386.1 hypothetical protein [Winogradskyella flava]
MIKFFRQIRYDLMKQNKTSKYFKYAIGEIILVMVGILLALGINNWNQDRLYDKQELNYLGNLKEELANNLDQLSAIDSVYSYFEKENIKGMTLLKNSPSIYEFKTIDSLVSTMWMTFQVTSSTYNEMLNNGSFYTLKNKTLKNQIDEHYSLAKRFDTAFLEINSNGQNISYNKDIYPLELLLDRLNENPINLSDIDTSWIHNPNSKIYTGYFRKVEFYIHSSQVRIRLTNNFSKSCKRLIDTIDKELKHHD